MNSANKKIAESKKQRPKIVYIAKSFQIPTNIRRIRLVQAYDLTNLGPAYSSYVMIAIYYDPKYYNMKFKDLVCG